MCIRDSVNVAQGVDGKMQILVMFLGRQRAGGGELVVVGGPVGKMPPGDDQLVAATEEGVGELQPLVQGHPFPGGFVESGRLQPLFRHPEDMLAAGYRGQIVALVQFDGVRELVAEVFPPVIERDDFEQVGNCLLYTSP